MADRAPTNAPKLAALAKRKASPAVNGLDGLIRAHAAMIRKGDRRALSVISDTDEMLAAMRAKATRLAAPGGAPVARAKVQQTIGQLQEIQSAYVVAGVGRIKKQAQAAAIEAHESVLKVSDAEFGIGLDELSAAQLKAIANQKVMGESLNALARKVNAARQVKLGQEMQAGVALGEGFDQIAARLKTIADVTELNVVVLARTTIQTAANNAARETYAAHDDILAGMVWVATLDDRTCPSCGPLDGREFYYKPEAGQSSVESMPEAPLHPNCRCFASPIVRDMPRPSVPTWEQWIKRQPAETQDEVLGSDRAELLRAGVAPSEFITKTGALRSVEALRRAAP